MLNYSMTLQPNSRSFMFPCELLCLQSAELCEQQALSNYFSLISHMRSNLRYLMRATELSPSSLGTPFLSSKRNDEGFQMIDRITCEIANYKLGQNNSQCKMSLGSFLICPFFPVQILIVKTANSLNLCCVCSTTHRFCIIMNMHMNASSLHGKT